MIVTINTDASFSRKLLRGSYAFWIVCNEFKIMKSGLIRRKIKRAEIAETMCIINAMYCLAQQPRHRTIAKIIVNTDCLNAIAVLKKQKSVIKKYRLNQMVHLQKKFDPIAALFQCEIEFRHVKAHTTTEGARNWVNDWCDQRAKQELRKILNQPTKVKTT